MTHETTKINKKVIGCYWQKIVNVGFVCHKNRSRGVQQHLQQVQQRVQGAVAQAATQAAVNELTHAFSSRFK